MLAHVEALEEGTHQVTIMNQPGCTVGLVHLNGIDQRLGPQTLSVVFPDRPKDDLTHFIQVACTVTP